MLLEKLLSYKQLAGVTMNDILENIDHKKAGKVLIWVGVFAWVPYIYLITNDVKTSIWPYLIVHLTGNIVGGILHGPASAEEQAVGRTRKKLSKILIYVGVMAWLPYIYLTNVVGAEVDITPYLTFHLTGIFSGIIVRLSVNITEMQKKKAEAAVSAGD